MATLPDMLRAEQARCQQLSRDYASLGSAGAFARALLEQALAEAQQALRIGDICAIAPALERLRTFREVMPDCAAAPSHWPATVARAGRANPTAATPDRGQWYRSSSSPGGVRPERPTAMEGSIMNILLRTDRASPVQPGTARRDGRCGTPDTDPVDAERALRELDRRGMALLSHVGLVTLVLALVSGLVTVMP